MRIRLEEVELESHFFLATLLFFILLVICNSIILLALLLLFKISVAIIKLNQAYKHGKIPKCLHIKLSKYYFCTIELLQQKNKSMKWNNN